MSEQTPMDRLLSRELSAPIPTLSSDFERHLTQRLRPRRLDARGRLALITYGVLSTIASIAAMRQVSMEWSLVAVSLAVPVVVVAIVLQRSRRPRRIASAEKMTG